MLDGTRRVHLIGIGGIGVSGMARILHARGFEVSGSDVRESSLTRALRAEGITVHIGHSAEHVRGVDLVVVSTAIPGTNPELAAARDGGVRVVHRSEVLGEWMAEGESVGVLGTHGKGTVSAMITWTLRVAGRDPSWFVGALCPNLGTNAHVGTGPIVAEVDESDGTQVNTKPDHVVVNNLELDHLHYYADWDKLEGAMRAFFEGNPGLRTVVANADEPGVHRMLEVAPELPLVTFGMASADADFIAKDVVALGMGSRFRVVRHGEELGSVELGVPGLYNAMNALAATALTWTLGVPFETIAQALGRFEGLENRFTLVRAGGIQVVKDYISHPTGIRRVLEACRTITAGRVWGVFKPYRFTMIHYLQDDYRECFREADHVVVTEMYTAGEVPIPGVDTDFLCRKIAEGGAKVSYVPEMDRIEPFLLERVQTGDMVVFFGGDDLFELADHLIGTLGGA
jgi:UDP-N-acetylmuramate--alanine ligase